MPTNAKTMDGSAEERKERLDGHAMPSGGDLATASEAVIEFIKEKPVLCLLGALAAGYVFGRIVRR